MICIVDYGLGNVQALINMFTRLNITAARARTPDDLQDAQRIVLPGVGAFDHAMELLDASGMRPTLDDLVMRRRVPIFGVCVGMQILASSSAEGQRPGLGWVPGRVHSFKSLGLNRLMVPHIGWNDVQPTRPSPLFQGLERDSRFYFLHSFFFECDHEDHVLARASYGIDFACAVGADNVYGAQFHPEKSHHFGAELLRNFAQRC